MQMDLGKLMMTKMHETFGEDMSKFNKVLYPSPDAIEDEESIKLKQQFKDGFNSLTTYMRENNVFEEIEKKNEEITKEALNGEQLNTEDPDIMAKQYVKIAELQGLPMDEKAKEYMLSDGVAIQRRRQAFMNIVNDFKEIYDKAEKLTEEQQDSLITSIQGKNPEEIKELLDKEIESRKYDNS